MKADMLVAVKAWMNGEEASIVKAAFMSVAIREIEIETCLAREKGYEWVEDFRQTQILHVYEQLKKMSPRDVYIVFRGTDKHGGYVHYIIECAKATLRDHACKVMQDALDSAGLTSAFLEDDQTFDDAVAIAYGERYERASEYSIAFLSKLRRFPTL